MNSPIAKFVNWQLSSGQLDHWTSYHIAAGLAIAKIAQWLGCSDLWAVLWVVIIGVAWEIFEYFVEVQKKLMVLKRNGLTTQLLTLLLKLAQLGGWSYRSVL